MIDPVKAKLIELLPEIEQVCRGKRENHYCPNCDNSIGRPITLADVLRAIEEVGGTELYAVLADGEIWNVNGIQGVKSYGVGITWNLALDYDNQTQEVRAFIGKLLGVE